MKNNLQKKLTIPGIGDETKLIIAMTMYDESKDDLEESIIGIKRNLIDLQLEKYIHSKEVTVVLIADGEEKVKSGTKKYLEEKGYFNPNHQNYNE